jgi:hypothetical protein
VLTWGKGKFTKTIHLDKDKNVAVMMTKSGCTKFTTFATSVASLEPAVTCFVATGAPEPPGPAVVTNAEDGSVADDDESVTTAVDNSDATTSEVTTTNAEDPKQVDFEDHPESGIVSTERDSPLSRDQDKMYRLHVCAGHLSFSKIRAMARRGEVPRRLAKCDSPMCAACQFGKATRKPWRTKAKNRNIKAVTSPGECVSVDQLESRAVGFVAQLKGRLTKGRYRVATIFVDHYSRLGYVHLQKDSTSVETLKAKSAFELFARERGVTIQHYHADNGRFVDNYGTPVLPNTIRASRTVVSMHIGRMALPSTASVT